jgi:hypothetical protein
VAQNEVTIVLRVDPYAGDADPEKKVGNLVGGVVSPILAHIALHHVLDVWFTEDVNAHCKGQAIRCRYADDVVCAFQYERDAERFSRV